VNQETYRINWLRLILTLRGCGMTETEIARRIRVPRSSLDSWKSGSEPAHATGELLISLYCSELSLTRQDVPVSKRETAP
jgi:hypothetical protein